MSEAQGAWVPRVLGVDVSDGAGSEPTPAIGLVQFAKLRLRWQSTKQSVASELARLRTAVQGELPDDPLLGNLGRLSGVLAAFNEGLSDALDDLANADTPEKRRAAAAAAQAATDHYLDHVLDDPLIDHIETDPFMDVRVSAHLLPPLSAISAALGSIALNI